MKNTKNNSKSRSKGNKNTKNKQPYDSKRNHKKQTTKTNGRTEQRPTHTQKSNKTHQNTQKPRLKADLYGIHAVTQAWINPSRHIHDLFITEKALESFDHALTKAHDLGLRRPAPQIIEKFMLDSVTPQGSVHQGIAINCSPLDEIDIHDIIRAEATKEQSILIILDQVTDPHNVGAIIRSACAFGSAGMILQRKHAPNLTGVLAKTACGGVEHLPIAYETNLARSIEALQKAGYCALGLAEEGETHLQSLSGRHQKIVLVLGAEGDGLRRLVREKCDALIALPTAGPISSLNVSNAAAVALFAVS